MKKIISIVLSFIMILILSSTHAYASDLRNPSECISVIMVGDDLIHQPLYKAADNGDGTYDFTNQFANIPEIKTADIAIINQETILVDDYTKISSYPCFGTPVEIADDIVSAGFDVVAAATNHAYDKGYAGIESTLNYWNTHYPNIPVLGIHTSDTEKDYTIYQCKDVKIGFVNYTYGINGITRTKDYAVDMLQDADIESTMKECASLSDIQIAILHVGDEYRYNPTEYQKQQINKFIDLGADIIICAHPHVVEPYERVTTETGNTGVVYYSLGNFISGQTEIDRCLGGMAAFNIIYTKDNGKITASVADDFTMIPLFTHQSAGNYTTYKLSNYTDDMLKKHKLYGKTNGSSVASIQALYDSIVKSK